VPVELAARLIAEQFPALEPRTVEPFGNGWDNIAYLVDGATVFRFPRRAVAVALIERELRALGAIAARVPAPVPDPIYAGRPSAAYRWPFAGYRLVAGEPATAVAFDDAARAGLAPQLGAFLRALHAVAPADVPGLTGDEWGRFNPARREPLRERLERTAAAGRIGDCAALLAAVAAVPEGSGAVAVVHGDLYARHVLVGPGGGLAGVIDWGDVHAGDPAVDLAIAHAMLPLAAHPAFLAAYGPVDERTWARARFRALDSCALIVEYGDAVGDEGLVAAGLAGIGFIQAALAEA
jgi:aminoglycoside phosphotransferase (APT) family kinase protein